jgi:hypothetical protein
VVGKLARMLRTLGAAAKRSSSSAYSRMVRTTFKRSGNRRC